MDIKNPRSIIPKSEFDMNIATVLLLFQEKGLRGIGVVVFIPFCLPKDMLMSNYLEEKFREVKGSFRDGLGREVEFEVSSPEGFEPVKEIGGMAKVGIWHGDDKELQIFEIKHGHWTYGEGHGWAEFKGDWDVVWGIEDGEKRARINSTEIREEEILEIFSMTETAYTVSGKEE